MESFLKSTDSLSTQTLTPHQVSEISKSQNFNSGPQESQDVPIKRKKGRPPKNKSIVKSVELDTQDITTNDIDSGLSNLNLEDKEEDKPKKRGRKKKEKPAEEEVKIKKKRGRKAALKFYSSSIRKKIPINTEYQNNETIILHLDVDKQEKKENEEPNYSVEDNEESKIQSLYNYNDTKDEDDDLLETYLNEEDVDPTITLKTLYDQKIEQRMKQDSEILDKLNTLDYTDDLDQIEVLESTKHDPILSIEQHREKDKKNGYITVLYEMVENKNWLEKVNIKCWWCCHTFDDVPLGFPIKYKEDTKKFLVKGCFCSIACLLSYDKSSLRKLSNSDNSYSLIRFMYTKLYGKSAFDKLIPAPPRESLIEFGGTLTIDEFRNSSDNGKVYKMIEYPMIVVRDFIEEIDLNLLKERNSNRISSKTKLTLKDDQIQEAKTRLSMLEISNTSNTIDKFITLSKF